MGCPILYNYEQNFSKKLILYAYDNAGNPTSYKGATLGWTNGRQLSSYSSMNSNISYKYDYNGMRTHKNNTRYLWQGDRLIAENNEQYGLIWYYYDESGVCGMRVHNQDFFFHKNILGDIVEIYDIWGTVRGTYTYDAWGNIIAQTDNCGWGVVNMNPFRYRGYYYDKETSLYYLQSRYYYPETDLLCT